MNRAATGGPGPAAQGMQRAQQIEISAEAYAHNLAALRGLLPPGTRAMAVVKANAYGHGARIVTPLALDAGIDYLGVHSLEEFEEIQDLCGKVPVCVLGPTLPFQAAATVAAGVEPTVSSLEVAEALAAAARDARRSVAIHLKVETGTHRQGILPEEIPDWCAFLGDHREVALRGLHTHFANIEDTTDHSFARRQLARMEAVCEAFAAQGVVPEITHTACSAATIVMGKTHADLARLGIASFGLWPSRETCLSARFAPDQALELQPVLSWRTRIAQIKPLAEGEYVGYGCTFRATRAMHLAVIPVGYYDGYDRRLSGRGHVLIRRRRAAIVGRVCMNLTMIDVSDIRAAEIGDAVTLIGKDDGETVSADSLAALCGTIHYEIVSRLGRHIPRVLAPKG